MRHSTLILLLVALFPTACTSGPGPLSRDERAVITQEVAETMAGLTEAMNSHDPEQVFSFYRQDVEFFYFGCTNPLVGWGTFSPRAASYYLASQDVTFEQEIITIQVLGPEVAVVAMRGSSTEAPALFWTEVLQKGEEGRWLITYEHESWPGCPVPSGSHMGAEGMPGMEAPPTGEGGPSVEGSH